MKEYVKYHAFDIPRKYRVDIRITDRKSVV